MRHIRSLLLVALALAATPRAEAWLVPPADSPTARAVDPSRLARFVTARRHRFPEFRKMAAVAEAHGVRLWLWGGTAASFLHDSRWHLLAEDHPELFRPGRLRDELDAVFRSAQDFDLATNGRRRDAHAIQADLQAALPGLKFEVRSLVEGDGDKDPLLSDDVLRQHSDTGSRGLVALTGDDGPGVVTDLVALRDGSTDSEFLGDGAAAILRFVRSDRHEATRPFLEGRNPPVLSVLRYLIKACAFDLRIPEASWQDVRSLAYGTDVSSLPEGRARDWLSRQGRKVVMHALDMRRGFALLDALALLPGLKKLDPYWFSRIPLGSLPRVSPKDAVTAKDRNFLRLAHDARTIEAFEAITWDPAGRPNFFVTDQPDWRHGVFAANAAEGIHENGLTVTLHVDHDAVIGRDLFDGKHEVVLHNRDVLRLAPIVPEEDLASWIDPKRFEANSTRGYVLATLNRNIVNGSTRISPEIRDRAYDRFVDLYRQSITDPPADQPHWAQHLALLYALAQPRSTAFLEEELARMRRLETPDADVKRRAAIARLAGFPDPVGPEAARRVIEERITVHERAMANDEVPIERLAVFSHTVFTAIDDLERAKAFRGRLVAAAVRQALREPALAYTDPERRKHYGAFASDLVAVEEALFRDVASDAIPARVDARLLFGAGRAHGYGQTDRSALLLVKGAGPLLNHALDTNVTALAWLTQIDVDTWSAVAPMLRAHQDACERVTVALRTSPRPTRAELALKMLAALVPTPQIESEWETFSTLLDQWLRAEGFREDQFDGEAAKDLVGRWLERLETELPEPFRPAQLRFVTDWYARGYVRTLGEARLERLFMEWHGTYGIDAEALFGHRWPTIEQGRVRVTAEGHYLTTDMAKSARQSLERRLTKALTERGALSPPDAATASAQLVAALAVHSNPAPGPALWKNLARVFPIAGSLFGAAFQKHVGRQAVGPAFTKQHADGRDAAREAAAIRALFALHVWDFQREPLSVDAIGKVVRKLVQNPRMRRPLDSLVLSRAEYQRKGGYADWRRRLKPPSNAACSEWLESEE